MAQNNEARFVDQPNQAKPKRKRALPWFTLLLGCLSCQEAPKGAPQLAETGPNAAVIPAPLLSGSSLVTKPQPSGSSSRPTRSAGTAESRLHTTEPFSIRSPAPEDPGPDSLGNGILLEVLLTWPQQPQRPALFGLDKEELDSALRELQRTISVDLMTYDRMRLSFETRAFPLQQGSTLLARREREGHLLLWPDERSYRAVPRGAVRALLRERRLDATPTVSAEVQEDEAGHRFDLKSERFNLTTGYGKLRLEQVPIEGLGHGGALFCRFLLELISAAPAPEVCRDDWVPVSAHFTTQLGGELILNATGLRRRVELSYRPTLVPPSTARLVTQGLPDASTPVLAKALRQALRRKSEESKLVGLTLKNPSVLGGYALLDKTPIAFLEPRSRRQLDGFQQADYMFSAVTFFGEVLTEPVSIALPAMATLGTPIAVQDAGAP